MDSDDSRKDFFVTTTDSVKNLMLINSICSCIRFTGDGIEPFLNNLILSDVKSIPTSVFQFSALCNPKGRIISSFWIYKNSVSDVLLVCPQNMASVLIDFFNMRKFRAKISIEEVKVYIGISIDELILAENGEHEYINEDGFYNYLFSQNLPWIDVKNTEKFIPQHLNLDQQKGVMSFTKGCYPGQEIVARIQYLGKIKKRMKLMQNVDSNNLQNLSDNVEFVSPIIYYSSNGTYSVQIIETL
ncbi:MAG: hypothetical protein R3F25_00925 [Gammaproteobacteria bacterium]|jgi:hypothetical protein|nr:hypothetical protein [Xanthomonadales bacterium]